MVNHLEQKNESNSAVFEPIFSEYNFGSRRLFELGCQSVRKVSWFQNNFSEIFQFEMA